MDATTLSISPFRNTPFLTKIVSVILSFIIIIMMSVLTIIVTYIVSSPHDETATNIVSNPITLVLLGIVTMYYYDKYLIHKFYHSPLDDKISALEEKLAELEDENQYLISMDIMRQEEWEKLMRTQSKVCTKLKNELKNEFEQKFKNYNKMLKKIEKAL